MFFWLNRASLVGIGTYEVQEGQLKHHFAGRQTMSQRGWATFGWLVSERYRMLQEIDGRPSLQDQALLGGQLLSAKICLPRRYYIPWLRDCTTLNQRTAARYIARWRKCLEAKGWDPDRVIEDLRDLSESLARQERAAAKGKS